MPQASSRLRSFLAGAAAAAALWAAPAFGQQEEYRLDPADRWQPIRIPQPGSEEAQLLEARRALENGDAGLAKTMATRFLDARPLSPLRPEALLLKGDALVALDDEYEALYPYEEIARKYPGSEVFVTALEREFAIAKEYAAGKRRKFFGTFRILSTFDDAQELLIRIQERLPSSELAEQAGMELADLYFNNRELRMAAEAYDLFLENYPRSPMVTKARLRLIYSYLAGFKGPEYDPTGLIEAKARVQDLVVQQPAVAEQVGGEAILVRIYESEASKLLSTADWYWQRGDAISTERFIRRLVRLYPDSVATLDALRVIPEVVAKIPPAALVGAPDYEAMRQARLQAARPAAPAADPSATVAPSP